MKKNCKVPARPSAHHLLVKTRVRGGKELAVVRQRAVCDVPDEQDLGRVLAYIDASSARPESDLVKVLLSFCAGLRPDEIAELRWDDCLTADGEIGKDLVVGAGRGSSYRRRVIPIHPVLAKALSDLRERHVASAPIDAERQPT